MINADSLISKLRYVKDRLGHDFRYALKTDLNNDIFQMTKLNKGLEKTIDWYLETKNKIINYKKGVYAFE